MSKMLGWGRCLMIGALLVATPALRAQEVAPLSLDEEYARIAERVPGFGGLYLDEQGTTHVYLQDPSHAREVQDLGEHVDVHQGEYDFRDLLAWREEVRPLMSRTGVSYLDIEERRNRLLFGVEPDSVDAFTGELRAFLRSSRVPPEAVVVEAAEGFEPLELLTDKIRPIPGGVQITRPINSTVTSVCTLGVNAFHLGIRGFVTNSHCSRTRGSVDGSDFFQNLPGSQNEIGTEMIDPPFFILGPCPLGKFCRRSDASFVGYNSQLLPEQARIANPISCGPSPGSILVDSDEPRLTIIGAITSSPFFPAGIPVRKVGRTTGCTTGPIKSTCIDVNVQDTFFTMLCQNIVSAASGPGDSGSPVFFLGSKGALLSGILWGGNSTSFVYSPWRNVVQELGTLDPL